MSHYTIGGSADRVSSRSQSHSKYQSGALVSYRSQSTRRPSTSSARTTTPYASNGRTSTAFNSNNTAQWMLGRNSSTTNNVRHPAASSSTSGSRRPSMVNNITILNIQNNNVSGCVHAGGTVGGGLSSSRSARSGSVSYSSRRW